METKVVKEKALYSYYGCCSSEEWGYEQTIELFHDDLIKAKVGKKWFCTDQDRYPNRTMEWTVTVEVVYRNDSNIYLHCYDSIEEYDELIAIELKTSKEND